MFEILCMKQISIEDLSKLYVTGIWYMIYDKSLCFIKMNSNEVKVTFENVH